VTDKERIMGLGGYDLTLAQARKAADRARDLVEAGRDPLEQKASQQAATEPQEPSKGTTFRELAELFLEDAKNGWNCNNGATEQYWKATLGTYVYPKIAHMLAADVKRAMF
jgi:hypothetical protein